MYSREQNLDSEGVPRRNLNMQDLDALYKELEPVLGEELAGFIYMYRLYGPKSTSSQQQGGAQPCRAASDNDDVQHPDERCK